MLAIADLFMRMGQLHQDMGVMYDELAMHLDPSLTNYEANVLAQAIQGEGAAMFGERRDEVAVWIVHTAYNRWEKPWWKRIDGVDCTFAARVVYDWHGIVNVSPDMVEPWARRIAYRELYDRRRGGIDRANGALFAYSLEDLRNNGWIERAREMRVHRIISPDDERVQFWFLSDDPSKGEDE